VALGIYVSVPFCRTKCSYCNFASGVFSRAVFERYVDRVCTDVASVTQTMHQMGARIDFSHVLQQRRDPSTSSGQATGHPSLGALPTVDSIYLGGGTPTVLEIGQLQRIFRAIRGQFEVQPDTEITVECAPGTLTTDGLDGLLLCGVNRVSLGVQSFVDGEAASVGRLHKRSTVLDDIGCLRGGGIENINVDLIAGLPHQTPSSWKESLASAIDSGVPHVSVYMLEVDEDSRLGRELIAGGTRYHAHFVPDDEATADFYVEACETLKKAGVPQYEISNFARAGFESRHNLKYWTRQPYLGFGVDAHSMLFSASEESEAVRFATTDSLEKYVAGSPAQKTPVSLADALEECFFLGLRLNRGVDLRNVADEFGCEAVAQVFPTIKHLESGGLIDASGNVVRLTPRGRLLSNEVFQAFLAPASSTARV